MAASLRPFRSIAYCMAWRAFLFWNTGSVTQRLRSNTWVPGAELTVRFPELLTVSIASVSRFPIRSTVPPCSAASEGAPAPSSMNWIPASFTDLGLK